MQTIKEFIGAALGIALVIGMWGLACMVGVLPIIIGLWLWRVIL